MNEDLGKIALFLSLLVILGHEFVPHVHEHEIGFPEHSVSLPHSHDDGMTDLGHLLGHFQHMASDADLTLISTDKTVDSRIIDFQAIPFIFITEPMRVSDGNKSAFFKPPRISLSTLHLNGLTLRGPPLCC